MGLFSTKEKMVDISPQGLYERMVDRGKGFGSFCFGLNALMKGVLQGLNYR